MLVPLSTLLRPPELAAQLAGRGGHPPRRSPGRSAAARYLDDLEAVAPGVVAATARPATATRACRRCARVWLADDLPTRRGRRRARRRARSARSGRPTTSSSCSPRAAAARRRATIHTHGSALRAVASGLDARCVGADDRLYIPMPFFWTGGFGGGLLTALVAGATLLTEAMPEPERTLALLERERATLFRGWPDQAAAPRRRTRRSRRPTCRASARAACPPCCPPTQRPAPGRAGEPLRHDRDVRPVLRRPARPRPARRASAAAAAGRSTASRCASSTPTPARRARRARSARSASAGRNVMRGICGRPATRRSTPTASTRPATSARSMPTATSGSTAASTTCSRSRARPCTRPRSRPRSAPSTACARRTSPNVPGDDGSDAVGALVVSTAPLDELVAGGPRAAQRVQGADAAGS